MCLSVLDGTLHGAVGTVAASPATIPWGPETLRSNGAIGGDHHVSEPVDISINSSRNDDLVETARRGRGDTLQTLESAVH